MNRLEAIQSIYHKHSDAVFILSNGLTSREASHYLDNEKSFYLLHAMGEALSVGIGLAQSRPELEIVVIDGDGNALMGMASWSMKDVCNIKYYVLNNGIYQTTGGQQIPELPFIPDWVNIIEIDQTKSETPNLPSPKKIISTFTDTLENY